MLPAQATARLCVPNLDSNVMVMQATEYRARTDVTVPLNRSMHRRVPSEMRLEFERSAISGNMKVSFQAARSIG